MQLSVSIDDASPPFSRKVDQEDSLLWAAVNPYGSGFAVWAFRALVLGVGFFGFLFASLHEFLTPSGTEVILSVGLSIVLSSLILRAGVACWEHTLGAQAIAKARNGQLPMVSWFSFTVFLEIAYTSSNPRFKHDPRDDELRHESVDDGIIDESESYWFDFVADIGDGFDPTYAVAAAMSRSHLDVEEMRSRSEINTLHLPRADFVVVGGDIAYPTCTQRTVQTRFLHPYESAFPSLNENENDDYFSQEEPQDDGFEKDQKQTRIGPEPRMYLHAGNHEYMDGLVGMRKYLLTRSTIGGWKTPQEKTYFSIKLPHGWWMFILDAGPTPEDLDEAQVAFFNEIVATKLDRDDKIILVHHVPVWIKTTVFKYDWYRRWQNFLHGLGDRCRIVLSGDLHYYRRMEQEGPNLSTPPTPDCNVCETENRIFLVAGHGGAFGHSTGFPAFDRVTNGHPHLPPEDQTIIREISAYPTGREWNHILNTNWPTMLYTGTNADYSRVLGTLYMFLFFTITPDVSANTIEEFAREAGTSPFGLGALVWMLVSHTIMIIANNPARFPSKDFWKTIVLVLLHTSMHVLVAIIARRLIDVLYLFAFFGEDLLPSSPDVSLGTRMGYCIVANISMYMVGALIGPFVMSLYFILAVKFFNMHSNEALSAIQWENHKGFVRIHITDQGDLELHHIAIDRPPRSWDFVPPKDRTDQYPGRYAPRGNDQSLLDPYLHEKILLRRNNLASG